MSLHLFDLPTTYVDTPETLAEALPAWHGASMLAVDIECSLTGMHHCVLALVQIATDDHAWILDPLPIQDLMPAALEAMATVPWIVHDYSGDGIVLKRLYNVVASSVLDTMLLARTLGYPQPGLKTMAKLKLGIDIPKEEQDSNWMLRPLREAQIRYASRDAALLMPLLRALGEEAEARIPQEPDLAQRLAQLPKEMRALFKRIHAYKQPRDFPLLDKLRGHGPKAETKARKLMELRNQWGNEGDVGAVMETGNRWMLARILHPPTSKEQLERTIPNPRFRRKRLDTLWEVLGEPQIQVHED